MRLFLAFLLCFLLSPCRADIIWAVNKTTTDYKSHAERYYSHLPKKGKDIPVIFTAFNEKEWKWEGLAGVYYYNREPGSIEMKSDSGEVVFKHEYGHHVWFKTFSEEDKKEWKNYWKRYKNDMPCDYAKENEVEGFAECYALTYLRESIIHDHDLKPHIKTKIESYFK